MGCVGSTLLVSAVVIPISLRWSTQSLPSSSSSSSSRKKLLSSRKITFPCGKNKQKDFLETNKGEAVVTDSATAVVTGAKNSIICKFINTRKDDDNHHWSVLVVLVAAFLNLLGFTITGPITPALGKHFDLQVGASFGSLTSAYPLGMLFGLFFLPQLSDRIGRKPVISASLFGSGLGLIAQSLVIRYNGSIGIFLATRVLTGCFAGSSPVSKAYLADVGSQNGNNLPRYLAMRDAASTMAFVVGPLLGGLMYELRRRMIGLGDNSDNDAATKRLLILQTSGSLAFVIQISGIASVAAATLVAFCVKEISSSSSIEGNAKKSKNGSNKIDRRRSSNEDDQIPCPLGMNMWAGVASLCAISFLYNVGDSTFHAFFSAMLRDQVHLDTKAIGFVYTALACVSLVVSTGFSGHLMQKYGPVASCAVGLSAIGLGLLLLGFGAGSSSKDMPSRPKMVLGAATIYHCGVPLYCPSIPAMLLRCVPPHRRGAVMGLDGTIKTFGRAITPLVMGEIYRKFGPTYTFTVTGYIIFVAVATTLIRRCMVLRAIPPKDVTK